MKLGKTYGGKATNHYGCSTRDSSRRLSAYQLAKSLEKLKQYPPEFSQIDNEKLVTELQKASEELTPRRILILHS